MNLTDKQLLNIASSIISNELAMFNNEQIKPIKAVYNRELKKTTNLQQKQLERTHASYLEFEKDCEDSSDDLYSSTFDMVREISKCGLQCSDEIKALVLAYQKSPGSMLGLANKLLR